jgi:hypothetical protein
VPWVPHPSAFFALGWDSTTLAHVGGGLGNSGPHGTPPNYPESHPKENRRAAHTPFIRAAGAQDKEGGMSMVANPLTQRAHDFQRLHPSYGLWAAKSFACGDNCFMLSPAWVNFPRFPVLRFLPDFPPG